MNPHKSPTYQRYSNLIINKSQSLGSGNFGSVYKGYIIHQNNKLQKVAIKQSYNEYIREHQNQNQNIKQIQTLQILRHQNIVQYKDYKISGNYIFLVMELCQGGTLDDLLQNVYMNMVNVVLLQEYLLVVYRQIISGIKFMYSKKILHRDLKPSNILISKNNVVKIADFGTSKIDRNNQSMNKLRTLVGTPLFFSPQLFQMNFGQSDTYTEKSQIWALGLILYYMFNYEWKIAKPADRMKESLPWSGRTTLEIFKNIKTQPLKFKKPQNVPQKIQQLIKKMLVVNAQQRLSFSQLFSHQLFTSSTSSSTPGLSLSTSLQSSSFPTSIPQQISEQIHVQQQPEQRTLIPATRENIDPQLLQILQYENKQQENYQQFQEVKQFYQMIGEQLRQYVKGKGKEGKEGQYAELVLEIDFKRYQVCRNQEQRQHIRNMYKGSKLEGKQKFVSYIDKWGKATTCIGNISSNPSITPSPINLSSSPTLSSPGIPLPTQHLLILSKSFIKQNINKLPSASSPKSHPLSHPLSLHLSTQMLLVYLIYDLYTLITFQKSWEMKKRSHCKIIEYKRMRNMVKMETLLMRIQKAKQCVKI